MAMAAQAKVLSGNKLEQLVVRLQRHTGQTKEACWRFIIRHGLKGSVEHRRWTPEEIDEAREELAKHSVEEVARKLKRTPKALRCALQRNDLRVRDIRCDCFSVEALAGILHVRKDEILRWIKEGWLPASTRMHGRRPTYSVTPDAFSHLYKKHLHDLLATRRLPSLSLFEAFHQYCYMPKHTIGEQLLDVRRDKRGRAAYDAIDSDDQSEEEDDDNADDFDGEEGMVVGSDED